MYKPGRRWLLPEVLRSGVVLVDTACVGSAVLAWVGGYAYPNLMIALGSIFGVATLLAVLPGRRMPPVARTVAAVISADPSPTVGFVRRCSMVLRLNDSDGTGRQFVHVEQRTPTATWPHMGSRVVVEVTRARTPKVRVLWHLGVNYPEPVVDPFEVRTDADSALVVAGLDEESLRALPRLERVELIPAWEPSHLARQYLFPTEKFRGEWRRHWVRWVKEFAVGMALALLLLSDYRWQVGKVTIDFGTIEDEKVLSQYFWFAWVAWRGLTWLNNKLVLTNKRVMLIKGLFWRRVASVPLMRAADTIHTKSPLGVVLGYGTLRFSNVTVLRPLWRVSDLPNPNDLYLQLVEETFEPEAAEARRRAAPTPIVEEIDEGLDGLLAPQFIG